MHWPWRKPDPTITVREVPVPARPVRIRATLDFRATITVTEDMMGALDALVGYGDDAFLEAFQERLGKAYMTPHKNGLVLFFKAIREEVLPALSDTQSARRDLAEAERRRADLRDAAAKAARDTGAA